MIYDHKDKETLKKYAVRAFPTFVITDAEGTELMRQVGAPFSTPKDATEWFTKVGDALANVEKQEAAHKDKPEDAEAALDLAETYGVLGKGAEALKIYEAVIPKLKKEDKRYVAANLAHADALMGTMERDNQAEVGAKIGEIYDAVLPDLVKAKDERAIDPTIMNTRIKSMLNKKHEDARTEILALIEAFPKMERLNEAKFFAAYYAQSNEDTETAKAEYEAIVKAGPEDDAWVKNASKQLESLNKK
jgi:tetratricopeptide (TPR) repeat protein